LVVNSIEKSDSPFFLSVTTLILGNNLALLSIYL